MCSTGCSALRQTPEANGRFFPARNTPLPCKSPAPRSRTLVEVINSTGTPYPHVVATMARCHTGILRGGCSSTPHSSRRRSRKSGGGLSLHCSRTRHSPGCSPRSSQNLDLFTRTQFIETHPHQHRQRSPQRGAHRTSSGAFLLPSYCKRGAGNVPSLSNRGRLPNICVYR